MADLPTFLIIGAARAGTTALFEYLGQHPEVFMSPRKETNFFAFEGEVLDCRGPGADYVNHSVTELAAYRQLFEASSGAKAVGEASPLYLYSEKAPPRIHHHVPDARLIAVLRNPIEQAWSHFLYARRQMLEPLQSFEAALRAEPERLEAGWQPLFQYSSFPMYNKQLKRYFNFFSRNQIRIFLYESLLENPREVLRDIQSFIGVNPEFMADLSYRPNAGGVPRSRLLQDLVIRPHAVTRLAGRLLPERVKRRIRDAVSDRNLAKPALREDARAILRERLEGDVHGLQRLLGTDLSHWLN